MAQEKNIGAVTLDVKVNNTADEQFKKAIADMKQHMAEAEPELIAANQRVADSMKLMADEKINHKIQSVLDEQVRIYGSHSRVILQTWDEMARQCGLSTEEFMDSLNPEQVKEFSEVVQKMAKESINAAEELKKLEENSSGLSDGLSKVKDSGTQAKDGLGNVGNVLSAINPTLGSTAQKLSGATTSAGAFASALGGIAAVGAVKIIKEIGEEFDEINSKVRDAALEIKHFGERLGSENFAQSSVMYRFFDINGINDQSATRAMPKFNEYKGILSGQDFLVKDTEEWKAAQDAVGDAQENLDEATKTRKQNHLNEIVEAQNTKKDRTDDSNAAWEAYNSYLESVSGSLDTVNEKEAAQQEALKNKKAAVKDLTDAQAALNDIENGNYQMSDSVISAYEAIEDKKKAVTQANKDLRSTEIALQQAQIGVEEALSKYGKSSKEYFDAKQNEEKAQNNLDSKKDDIKDKEDAVDKARLNAEKKKQKDYDDQLAKAESAVQKAQDKVTSSTKSLDSATKALDKANEDYNKTQDQANKLKAEAEAADKALEAAESSLSDIMHGNSVQHVADLNAEKEAQEALNAAKNAATVDAVRESYINNNNITKVMDSFNMRETLKEDYGLEVKDLSSEELYSFIIQEMSKKYHGDSKDQATAYAMWTKLYKGVSSGDKFLEEGVPLLNANGAMQLFDDMRDADNKTFNEPAAAAAQVDNKWDNIKGQVASDEGGLSAWWRNVPLTGSDWQARNRELELTDPGTSSFLYQAQMGLLGLVGLDDDLGKRYDERISEVGEKYYDGRVGAMYEQSTPTVNIQLDAETKELLTQINGSIAAVKKNTKKR